MVIRAKEGKHFSLFPYYSKEGEEGEEGCTHLATRLFFVLSHLVFPTSRMR